MRDWLVGLAVAVGVIVASWALLILLARRLPPGPLRELARFIPDCVTAIRRLRRDPRVPRRARCPWTPGRETRDCWSVSSVPSARNRTGRLDLEAVVRAVRLGDLGRRWRGGPASGPRAAGRSRGARCRSSRG